MNGGFGVEGGHGGTRVTVGARPTPAALQITAAGRSDSWRGARSCFSMGHWSAKLSTQPGFRKSPRATSSPRERNFRASGGGPRVAAKAPGRRCQGKATQRLKRPPPFESIQLRFVLLGVSFQDARSFQTGSDTAPVAFARPRACKVPFAEASCQTAVRAAWRFDGFALTHTFTDSAQQGCS